MNLIDALESQGHSFRTSGKPNEVYVCCPFCAENGESPDSRFRLGINTELGWAQCFNCSWRTRDKEFLARELQRAFQTGMFEFTAGQKRQAIPVRLPEDFQRISLRPEKRDFWEKRAYRYLRQRGVTDQQIRKHRIGYSTTGKMGGRIVVPIYLNQKLKALVGRDFTGKQQPPYKNSIGEKYLFNVPRQKSQTAVLVEGLFDALAVERAYWAGQPYDALAVLGHSLTDNQIAQLKGYKRIVLWPDPDEQGVMGFLGMTEELQIRITKNIGLVTPSTTETDTRDPDQHELEEVRQKIRQAKRYTPELDSRLRAWIAFAKEDE